MSITTITLRGSLTITEGRVFFNDLGEVLNNDKILIGVDLDDVGYVDSAAIQFFIKAHKLVLETGGKIGFYNLSEELKDLFKICALDEILNIYKDSTAFEKEIS